MRFCLIPLAVLLLAHEARAQDMYVEEMKAISFIESTHGLNTQHALIKTGIHKGTRAGGEFGLMPLTVKGLIKNSKALQKKYKSWLSYSPSTITWMLNTNHKADQEIAFHFWQQLRKRYPSERAACSWYRGPGSKTCGSYMARQECEYTQKFRDFMRSNKAVTSYAYAKSP